MFLKAFRNFPGGFSAEKKKVGNTMEKLWENNENEMEERVILVGIDDSKRDISIEESMDELAELAYAAGAIVQTSIIQKVDQANTKTYVGKGKAQEIKELVDEYDAAIVICNDELTSIQLRNLEDVLNCRVIDRTVLILDIFAKRAESKVAKLQIELAQLEYRLPRLSGISAGLSRTGGGIGTRGPGEQKLEMDRRHIRNRIHEIQKKITEAKKVRETQRVRRQKNEIPVVALVGYTNAGKSSILNYLMDLSQKKNEEENDEKKVFVKDMLFATLDTFARKIMLTDGKPYLLVDTVGFVSNLPHSLVEAFKATLEEVVDANLLIQVVDASNEHYSLQMDVTNTVLGQLGAADKEMMIVYNKMDRMQSEFIHDRTIPYIYTSVKTGQGMNELAEKIEAAIYKDSIITKLHIPFTRGDVVAELCANGRVITMEHDENGTMLALEVKKSYYEKYKQFEM